MIVDVFTCEECEGGPCEISVKNKHCNCRRFKKNIQEEQELIKFHEAAPLMKVGDVFEPKDSKKWTNFEKYESENGEFYFKSTGTGDDIVSMPEHFNLEGKVMPAKPVVLSADEIIKNTKQGTHELAMDCERRRIRAGEKNGESKQWLKLKNASLEFHEMSIPEIEQAIENLKPLKP